MLNKVILQGRLGHTPEMRATEQGNNVASIDIAVPRQDKDADTDWITIVCWNKTAEFLCRYFHKGDGIIVTGKLQTRKYTNREDRKVTVSEVVAEHIDFPLGKAQAAQAYNEGFEVPGDFSAVPDSEDAPGLPFN